MEIKEKIINNIDEYIAQFSSEIQEKLKQIRKTIYEIAPNITESISYKMPAFSLNGKPLAYFAAFKNHIGFYPVPGGAEVSETFKKELSNYKQGKGSIQFPLNQPLPMDLIVKIVRFRMEKNRLKQK